MATKPLPTPEELRQLLRYEPETGKLYWRERGPEWFRDGRRTAQQAANVWNGANASKEAGFIRPNGYLVVRVFGAGIMAHRIVYAMHTGHWPDGDIDHRNGNVGDNRIANLRDVPRAINMRNARRRSDNTSQITGVYWNRRCGKWAANICVDGRTKYLGMFDRQKDAEAARTAAEIGHGFTERHGR